MRISTWLLSASTLPAAALLATAASASPVHYTIDPTHTYPSFEAPHIQGISLWRGKIDSSQGSVVLDRAAHTGSIEIAMDPASINFGNAKLDEHVRGPDFFDVKKYPTMTYKSTKIIYNGDDPASVEGDLTMHGVSHPVTLKINSFKCIMHPFLKKEVCGADAAADLNRADFGIDYGVQLTGSPMVHLAIQVEALRSE